MYMQGYMYVCLCVYVLHQHRHGPRTKRITHSIQNNQPKTQPTEEDVSCSNALRDVAFSVTDHERYFGVVRALWGCWVVFTFSDPGPWAILLRHVCFAFLPPLSLNTQSFSHATTTGRLDALPVDAPAGRAMALLGGAAAAGWWNK